MNTASRKPLGIAAQGRPPELDLRARMLESRARLSPIQRRWLERGLGPREGKLPLFDENGQRISSRTVRSCLTQGLIEPLFAGLVSKDLSLYRLTVAGRRSLGRAGR